MNPSQDKPPTLADVYGISASDLVRIRKACEQASDRNLFVMLEPREALALVALAEAKLLNKPTN